MNRIEKVLLMGNPNVGKSVVFSRLTGIHAVSSNYPGTTVDFSQGTVQVNGQNATLIDVPGTYGLEATCKAEQIANTMLDEGDVVVNVVDATNLERNLHLTLHLLEQNIPLIVALNIWDEAKHKGIEIDVAKLEELLGVPVVPTAAVTGEGIKELVSRIPEARNVPSPRRSEEQRWQEMGRIVEAVQSVEHRHHTVLEVLGDISVKPLSGLPIAAMVMVAAFAVIRFIGETLVGWFEGAFEGLWTPLMMRLSGALGASGFLHDIFIGELIEGEIDFVQSFGVLTTGLFVPLAMVLPYVFSFYLILGVLEDFGYLPRLAVLLDKLMHRMGLHGWAIIPTLLGLGCNVPGIMAVRILENRRERFIAATIISIGVPCAALQAMVLDQLGDHGAMYVGIVYVTLFLAWVALGRILDAVLKGESPELLMEIPPYRLPAVRTLGLKLWRRMRGFLKEAVPIVLLGMLVVNVLHYVHVFDYIADFTAPVMTRLFGLPKEAIVAIVLGFLRKDVGVGMLGTLGLSAKQMVVSVTVLAMSFPCIATFVILAKELGVRDMLKSVIIMLAAALAAGTTLNFIL